MPDLWSQLQSYGDIEGISHEIVLKVIACIVALTLFALGTNAATLNVKKVGDKRSKADILSVL